MKKFLLIIICFVSFLAKAQAPVIEGDTMLCPNTNGTVSITSGGPYDTYQWYSKYWFSSDEYEPIDGATASSFTYDWYTYDQSLFKVVVTQGASTYESNTIQIDSYTWVGITIMHDYDENEVVFDPENGFMICDGATITNTLGMPFTVAQWYKNGQPIEGATEATYIITEPGTYYAVAAPAVCPNSTSTTLPITVVPNPDCGPVNPTPVVIEGDLMLCPNTNGTANVTNNVTYDSYQWYSKYWFDEEAEFEPIDGATGESFTYDWMTYDQSLFKVVVTYEGETYESNTIQIDSYNWASLVVMNDSEGNVVFDPDNGFLICDGASITNTIQMPYSVVQWYKNDQPIEGATDTEFVITEPGIYHAVAAPAFCPNATSTTLPIVVAMNPDCPADPTPVIEGDIMLCPNTNGTATITNDMEYDSYQWYFKYWFDEEAEFEAIEGATEASFTYDWYTYDQALFKVVVTLDGNTYESNTIQIDSHNWVGLTFLTEPSEDVVFNGDAFLFCDGSTITNTLNSPYDSSIQWYRDGEPIEGATEATYVITEPGTYYVEAAPAICPNATSNTMTNPIVVVMNPDCTMGVDNPEVNNNVVLYPNPAKTILNVSVPQNTTITAYTILDVTGKTLVSGAFNIQNSIDVSALSSGSYIIRLNGEGAQLTKMFIKE